MPTPGGFYALFWIPGSFLLGLIVSIYCIAIYT